MSKDYLRWLLAAMTDSSPAFRRQPSDKLRAYINLFEAAVYGWLGFLTVCLTYYLALDGKWLALAPGIASLGCGFIMWGRIMEAGVYYRAEQ